MQTGIDITSLSVSIGSLVGVVFAIYKIFASEKNLDKLVAESENKVKKVEERTEKLIIEAEKQINNFVQIAQAGIESANNGFRIYTDRLESKVDKLQTIISDMNDKMNMVDKRLIAIEAKTEVLQNQL